MREVVIRQFAVLQHGVDQGQGFLFGKAIPAAQVPQLLAETARPQQQQPQLVA